MACGDDAATDGELPDAALPDADPPQATNHKYVASAITLPARGAEPSQIGLDLDADGSIDNGLGRALVGVGAGFGTEGFAADATEAAVLRGEIILLAALETPSFDTADAVTLAWRTGATPSPAPCVDASDLLTCGRHLDGTGMFTIAPASPTDSLLAGTLGAGTLVAGPGTARVEIALGADTRIALDLVGARAELTGITAAGATFRLGGGIPAADVEAVVVPALQASFFQPALDACQEDDAPPPTCGCEAGTGGATLLSFFDTDTDCEITVAEILDNDVTGPLLRADLTIDGQPALSFGVTGTLAAAAFP